MSLSTLKSLSRAAEETGPVKLRQPAETQTVPIPASCEYARRKMREIGYFGSRERELFC